MATVTALSKVSVAINPEATSGSSGAHSYSALEPLERVGLLGHAKPMGMMPSLMGASPQPGPRPSSMGGGMSPMQMGPMGQRGMAGSPTTRGGAMGARGGAAGGRGGAMGTRGGSMGMRGGASR